MVEGGQRENTNFNSLASMRGRQSGPRRATWRAEAGPGQSDSAAARIYSRMEEARPAGRDPWEEAAVLQLDPKQQNSLPTLRRCKPVACLCKMMSFGGMCSEEAFCSVSHTAVREVFVFRAQTASSHFQGTQRCVVRGPDHPW